MEVSDGTVLSIYVWDNHVSFVWIYVMDRSMLFLFFFSCYVFLLQRLMYVLYEGVGIPGWP